MRSIFELFDTVPEEAKIAFTKKKNVFIVMAEIYTGHRWNQRVLRFLIWFSRKYKKVIFVIVRAIPAGIRVDQSCWVIIFIICKAIGPWSEGICDNRKMKYVEILLLNSVDVFITNVFYFVM